MKKTETRAGCRSTTRRLPKSPRSNSVYTAQDDLNSIEKIIIQLHDVSSVITRRSSSVAGPRNIPPTPAPAPAPNRTPSPISRPRPGNKPKRDIIEAQVGRRRARSADVHKASNAKKTNTNRSRRREECEINECDPTNVDCHLHSVGIRHYGGLSRRQYNLLTETQQKLLQCLPRGTNITSDTTCFDETYIISNESSKTIMQEEDPIDWDEEKRRGSTMSFESTNSVEFYMNEYRENKKLEQQRLAKVKKYQLLRMKVRQIEEKKRTKNAMKKRIQQEADALKRLQERDEVYKKLGLLTPKRTGVTKMLQC